MSASPAASRTRILFCGNHHPKEATDLLLNERYDRTVRDALEVKWCAPADVPKEAQLAEVLVPLACKLPRAVLENAHEAKVCIQYGVGVEGVDRAACDDLGIWVSNVPSLGSSNAVGVAELAIYLVIAALRQHNQMELAIQQRRVNTPIGDTLAGKRVLLVGFGGIGVEVAKRLQLWDCAVSALRAREWIEGRDGEAIDAAASHLHAKGTWDLDRLEFAKSADVVIVSAMANAANAGMIDRAFLETCPDGVVLVNVARGLVLDRDAVAWALDSGKIGGLAIDVFWEEPLDPNDPIVTHPRTYVTPHCGGTTRQSYEGLSTGIVEAALAVRAGKRPPITLNAPTHPRVGA